MYYQFSSFRLPQDMYQTAKVAKILLLMEKGRGDQFKGKHLNEIEIENEIYHSSESDDEECTSDRLLKKIRNLSNTHDHTDVNVMQEEVAKTDQSQDLLSLDGPVTKISEGKLLIPFAKYGRIHAYYTGR